MAGDVSCIQGKRDPTAHSEAKVRPATILRTRYSIDSMTALEVGNQMGF